jgi:hypothetical protein
VPSFPELSVNSDNLPFSYVILFLLLTYVTICMKLDPGMHIGLHLVFFGKTGVTVRHPPFWRWRTSTLSNVAVNGRVGRLHNILMLLSGQPCWPCRPFNLFNPV